MAHARAKATVQLRWGEAANAAAPDGGAADADGLAAADVVRTKDPAMARNVARLDATHLHERASQAVKELQSLREANGRLVQEIAQLREREAQAQRLAYRDGLTGLYNRRRMSELLEAAIADAGRGDCVGLLFIDLNGFKPVNDVYGHAAGDKLLMTMAARISSRVRAGDIVCRYGGDEFVVILPNAPDPTAVSRVADGIRERVSLPYRINGAEQHLSAAIGEALYPFDGNTAEALLHRADAAMYRFKSRSPHASYTALGTTALGTTALGTTTVHARRRGDPRKM